MSKYQEELNNISNFVLDDRANGYDEPRTFGQFYGSSINVLQELVDRATPKKPIKKMKMFESDTRNKLGICACGINMHEDNNFCSQCGQALDWSTNDTND